MLCFIHIVTKNLNFINIKSYVSIKSEYLPSVACQLMPSHQSNTWLFLYVPPQMQASAQSNHTVKVTNITWMKNILSWLKLVISEMLCYIHIVTNNLNFINIKSNLSIKSEYLPPVACQLMPSHQSDTWLFLCVHFEMQASVQSIHSVKVTNITWMKNIPSWLKLAISANVLFYSHRY